MKVIRQVPRSGSGPLARDRARALRRAAPRASRGLGAARRSRNGEAARSARCIVVTGRTELRGFAKPSCLDRSAKRLELFEAQGVELLVLAAAKRHRPFSGLIGWLGLPHMVGGLGSPERHRARRDRPAIGLGEIVRCPP